MKKPLEIIQGLINSDEDNNVKIWVPLYRKKLYSAFYPYSNGEAQLFFRNVEAEDLFTRGWVVPIWF